MPRSPNSALPKTRTTRPGPCRAIPLSGNACDGRWRAAAGWRVPWQGGGGRRGCEGSGWRQKTSGDLSQGVGHGRVLRVPRSRVLSQRDRQFFVVRVHCESRSNASKIRSSVIRAHRSHAPKAIPEVGLSRSIATTKPPGRSSLRERFSTVAPFLDERGRRLVAAAEAFAAGYGGIAAVAIATGVAPSTIGRGLKELAQDEPSERIRRPGAGRKRTISKRRYGASDEVKAQSSLQRKPTECPMPHLNDLSRCLAALNRAGLSPGSFRGLSAILQRSWNRTTRRCFGCCIAGAMRQVRPAV